MFTSTMSHRGDGIRLPGMDNVKLTKRFNTAMIALEAASRRLSTRERLLIQVHASRLNGCSFCEEMHAGEAAKKGIELTPINAREELILELTTMGTVLGDQWDDKLIDRGLETLGEKDTASVVAAIATINAWNRIGRMCRK